MSAVNSILVIGAGVAGPALCYWLRRFGFAPTLVEKATHIRRGGQALDIRGVAVDLVKKMGFYEALCARRTTVQTGRYVDADGNTLHEEQGARVGFRQDEEVEIIRGDLIEILMAAIADVPCRFDQQVSGIRQHADGVLVQYSEGRTEHYDLVIGADGIHSATRRMVFASDEYEVVNLGSYLSIFTIPNYLHLRHSEVLHEADHKMASITSDRHPAVAQAAFMFRSQRQLNNIRDEREQRQFLRETFQDFGWEAPTMLELMADSADFYFDAVAQVKMQSWTKGRVALLGDAGYCASPLSGQGNNLALVGAYILAGELKQAAGDYVRAFMRYNAMMRPFVEANQRFGAWVSESFLVHGAVTKEMAEERSDSILKEIRRVSHAITLPDYP